MPMFEYKCNECGTVSEILTGVSRVDPEVKCDDCDSKNVKKLISVMNFSVGGSRATEPIAPCGAMSGETCERCEHAG